MGCATSRPGKQPAPAKSLNPPPLMGSPFDGPSDGTRNKHSRMAKLRIKMSGDGFTAVPLKPIPAKENRWAGQRHYRHLGNRNPGVDPKSSPGEGK
ncbi:hypothetical protein LTR12_002260 [Friedmanniomyces endolithicus]|nr:hypothetical protein LTR12_002260 [Friedmanniomyces endolithicus]